MTNQSTNEASATDASDRVQRARRRRARDDQWLVQAKRGDADAYRQLVTEWSSGAFDRAMHRGADERSAADTVLRTFTSLQGQLVDDDTTFGARVMGAIERDVPARPRALGKANRGAKRAAERLTRGTDPAALGADPSISVMLWDALDVLGDRARDVTDLHWRHGLASDEIAAATGESIFRVDDIIRKAPQGLAAALRTRLLWAGGKPDHDELTRDLKANNVRQFDSAAVRVIHGHLRACSVCRSRSLIALPAIDIFEAIPLVALPADVERRITATAWAPFASGAEAAGVAATTTVADATPEETPAEADRREIETETEPEPESETMAALTEEPAPVEAREPAQRADTAVAGTVAAAGAAAAAFLAKSATSFSTADVMAAPAAEATAAPAPPMPLEPATTPSEPIDPQPTSAAGSAASVPPLAALTKTTPPSSPPPAEPRGGGPAHEPVASKAADRAERPRWLIPACLGVAAVILLGLVVVFTRGGSDKKTAIDAGPVVESTTTTRAPSSTTSTTAAPPVTAPPTVATTPTTAPSTTAGGGGGTNGGGNGGGGGGATTTTKAPAIIANVQYSMSPGTIRVSDGGSTFSWSVTANGPITVEVTGPGVSSSSTSGSTTVCNPASSCGVGTHYFSIVAKDADGRQVGAGTAKLIIRD